MRMFFLIVALVALVLTGSALTIKHLARFGLPASRKRDEDVDSGKLQVSKREEGSGSLTGESSTESGEVRDTALTLGTGRK